MVTRGRIAVVCIVECWRGSYRVLRLKHTMGMGMRWGWATYMDGDGVDGCMGFSSGTSMDDVQSRATYACDCPALNLRICAVVYWCRSLRYSQKREAWFIYHSAAAKLKGRGKSILLYLPVTATRLFNVWRDVFRPVLVKTPHEFVFVTKKGERRENLANVVTSVVARFPHIKSRGTARGLRSCLALLSRSMYQTRSTQCSQS
jgi:hypothetical protein